MTLRLPAEVRNALHAEARLRGVSMAQILSDLAAHHVGMADVARELTAQEVLPTH